MTLITYVNSCFSLFIVSSVSPRLMNLLYLFPAALAISFNRIDRSKVYHSCAEIDSLFINGTDRNGLFVREKFKINLQNGPRWVFCVFDITGAWTIVQKRYDGSVNFNQTWSAYKNGFGDFEVGERKDFEYWLGLDTIHNLTNPFGSKMRVLLSTIFLSNLMLKWINRICRWRRSNGRV